MRNNDHLAAKTIDYVNWSYECAWMGANKRMNLLACKSVSERERVFTSTHNKRVFTLNINIMHLVSVQLTIINWYRLAIFHLFFLSPSHHHSKKNFQLAFPPWKWFASYLFVHWTRNRKRAHDKLPKQKMLMKWALSFQRK